MAEARALSSRARALLRAAVPRLGVRGWLLASFAVITAMTALASGARVIAILTPAYLNSDNCMAEWSHTLVGDPLNRKRRLIVLYDTPACPLALT